MKEMALDCFDGMTSGQQVFGEALDETAEVFIVVLFSESKEVADNKPFETACWMRWYRWNVKV